MNTIKSKRLLCLPLLLHLLLLCVCGPFSVAILYAEGAKYLIITHDDFYNAILGLAEWKHKKGVPTKVVKLSETGPTASQIKGYIQNAYNTWNPRPRYVLLVGDIEFLESYYSWASGIYTDNYYAQLQGGDLFADVCIGRFSVDNLQQCSTMVAKTLGYERTPWTTDVNWFKSVGLIVRNDYDQDDSLWYYPDAQFAYNILSPNGFTGIDTMFERNGSHAGSVINSVNKGILFLGFRGSSSMNWRYPFDVNPYLLDNKWKLPIVVSATCLTGSFQEDGADCELWTRAGSPDAPKGAVAYLGTSTGRIGAAHIRSSLFRNFWRALFIDSLYVLGDVFVQEKLRFWNELADQKDYEGWHLFGDPELNIWTDIPKNMHIAHPLAVVVGSSNFTVTVKKETLTPLPGALVCLLKGSEIYQYGLTNASGKITFPIAPTTPDTMWVTVTAHNYIPYQGYCMVISGGPYVNLYKYTLIDTANNGDGIPNSGEHIWLPAWIKNYGNGAAQWVFATLLTSDPYITLIDSVEYFSDNIAAGDSVLSPVPYEFSIASNCPGGHKAEFEFKCIEMGGDSWASTFFITVTTPFIVLSDRTVDDAGQLTPNGFIDPGETVRLILKLENTGNAGANGVTATLRTTDTYTTIIDSFYSYGSIPVNSAVDNSADPYDLSCTSATPLYHKIPLSLFVKSTGGYEVTLNFNLKVGVGGDYLVWDPDINHTSGIIIDSLLAVKGYKGDYTIEIDDFEPYLSDYTSIFLCLGVYPNHYTLYIPANEGIVNSLIQFLINGGKMYIEGGETWAIHPDYGGNRIHPYLHTFQDDEGYADTDTIKGIASTLTSGMKFKYSGENYSMDRLRPGTGAWSIFVNQGNKPINTYADGIAFTYGSLSNGRKTILTTFELGSLSDTITPRVTLIDSIMKWFLKEAHHDISVWKIQAPAYFFVPGDSSVVPSIQLKNIGEYNETGIRVICNIDSGMTTIYRDSVIRNLNSGATIDVAFSPWQPGPVGTNYKISFTTELNVDEEPQNNITSKEVAVFDFSRCINSHWTLTTPWLDGEIDTTWEWLDAYRMDISNLYGKWGISSPQPPGAAYLYVMNNDTLLYFAIDMKRDMALSDGDKIIFYFDDNHNHHYPTSPTDSTEGCLYFYYWPPTGEFYYFNLLDPGIYGDYYTWVDLAHSEGIGAGNLQFEFALPMSWTVPEYINAAPGDTIGISIAAGYYIASRDVSYYYGWWPQWTDSIWHPAKLGDLVIAQYGAESVDNLPRVYKISQNIPNPALSKTSIFYELPVKSKVNLKIYNVVGQLVRTLVDGINEAGYKRVVWDGKDNTGRCVGSGVYWYRFEANDINRVGGTSKSRFIATKKIIFLAR